MLDGLQCVVVFFFVTASLSDKKQPAFAQTEFIESSQACMLLHNLKMQHSLIVSPRRSL